MSRIGARSFVGFLLVAAGLLLLLQNLGLLGITWNVLWAAIFVASGVGFLAVFQGNPARWWPLVPGFALLGLGTLVGVETFAPRTASLWGGSIFLGSIALGFLAVHLASPKNWWAIIPGGVLATLAAVAAVPPYAQGREGGAILFLGLAITFALVHFTSPVARRRSWALVTSGVMLAFALIIGVDALPWAGYLWPLILIVLGLLLIVRSVMSKRP